MPQPNEPMDADASKAPHGQPSPAAPRLPRQERVRHVLFGSLKALDRTVKILHVLGYAEPNDWSPPLWSEKRQSYMRMMTKVFWLE
jgi:hypothetical protein